MEIAKKVFSYLLPFILMFLFLYLAFRNIDLDKVIEIFYSISIFWLLVYIVVWYLSHIVRAYRWKIIIGSIKPNALLLNLFGATMVGYGINCVVPRLGELYRGLFLGKWEEISRSSMIGTVMIERVIDILVLGFSVLVSVAIYSGDLYKDLVWLKSTLYIGFLAIFGVILFLYFLVKLKDKFINVIVKFVGKFSQNIAESLSRIFHLLIDGFSSIRGTKNFSLILIHSVLIMLLYGLSAYIGFYILHMEEIQDVNFAMGWILMTISAFGVIIPTPGATGSYHLIVISVLVGLFGFSQEISGAYALITHAVSYIFFILTTIAIVQIINRRQKKLGLPVAGYISVFKNR